MRNVLFVKTKKEHINEIINKKAVCPSPTGNCVIEVATANLPTRFGNFRITAFYNDDDNKEHVAIIKGDVKNKKDVPVRLHSECVTGDALGSLRCDCRDQLTSSLSFLSKKKSGILLYLRQEGRGIGLINKIKAYHLQEHGLDTVEANQALGFPEDLRKYHIAADMLRLLGVKSIRLLTNNPRKIKELEENGIKVAGRIPLEIEPNIYNRAYLKTKKQKLGHIINILND